MNTPPDRDDLMTIPEATDWLLTRQQGTVLIGPGGVGALMIFGPGHRASLARLLPRLEGGDADEVVVSMLTAAAMAPSASDEPRSEQDAAEADRQELLAGWLDTVALLTAMLNQDTEAIAAALDAAAASPAAGRMAINLSFALLSEMSSRMSSDQIAATFEGLRRRVIDGDFPGAGSADGGDES